MSAAIVPVVEGHSEVESVPILLRRIFEMLGATHFAVLRPFRVKRYRVVKQGELERAIQVATRGRDNAGAVLVILDADDDCPAELGPELLERAESATGLPVAVVLANKEFEAWFLGCKESFRGQLGIAADALPPSHPEGIRRAKERLERNMLDRRYIEVDDQPRFTARMDLDLAARRCPSFAKLLRDVGRLVSQMGT